LLRNRLVFEWIAVALFGMLVAGASAWWGLTTKLDNLMLDVASPLRVAPPDDRILIVEIDNDTLAKHGNFPWARSVHAQFLDRAKAAGPRVIAYDILFLELMDAADDAAMAKAVGQGAPTYLPVLYQVPGENGASETLTLPFDPLPTAAKGLGEVNLLFDSDGLVRRAQLQTNAAGRAIPHLMELTYREVHGKPSAAHRRMLTDVTKATDEALYVPMAKVGTFRRLSYASVLASEVPPVFLKDKILLVGATADGMGDRYPVSAMAGSSMAGIEIQANLLNALIHDRFVQPVGRGAALGLSVLPVLALMLLFWRFKPTVNLLLSLAMIALVLAATLILITSNGLWFAPASALLGIILVYPLWGWRRLTALSGFIRQQAQFLRREEDVTGKRTRSAPLDRLGRQAADLEAVIAETSDRKRFMADVIAGLPDAMVVLDDFGRVTLANPAAQALFGIVPEGAPIRDLLVKSGAGLIEPGEEASLPDGRSFILREVGFPDRAGSIMIFADTTEIRALGREREEMLEFLSHDMRAPQSAILMLLSEGNALDDSGKARIADNAKKTLRLADDFVQLARLKAIDLDFEDVDIAAVASEAIDSCWPQASAKEVTISGDGLDTEAFIRGDAGALIRALTNLIDNAVKYGPAKSEVRCDVTVRAPNVIVTVSDQGPGLPPERLGDVFARFGGRGDTNEGGSGLGLAFVRAVVQRHGGDIDCASAPGMGTRFTISLPMADLD
jgi:signal transduction histidine kinase/CHASE2 domain-containing sensor protein